MLQIEVMEGLSEAMTSELRLKRYGVSMGLPGEDIIPDKWNSKCKSLEREISSMGSENRKMQSDWRVISGA